MARIGIPFLNFDDLITAIQALSAPSGTDVAISPTGMHIVTEDDVQGAISELDSAVDSVNASLTKLQQVQFNVTAVTVAPNTRNTILDKYNIKTSTATDTIFTNKTLAQLFGDKTILGVVGLWVNSGGIVGECIMWNDQTVSLSANNPFTNAISVSTVRLLVFYK